MTKVLLILICLVGLIGRASTAEFNPHEGPRPIVVLMESNPWLTVIGSDTPTFVLYEDGQVVFLKETSDEAHYLTKLLTPAELRDVKVKLKAAMPTQPVEKSYDVAPNTSDQATTHFYLDVDGKRLVTSIRAMDSEDESGIPSKFRRDPATRMPPKEMRVLRTMIRSLELQDARAWVPSYVEVMVWPYEYAPEESIHWPKVWPGLDSPNTRKHGKLHSIFVPGKEETAILAFLKTRKQKGAVEIDGKKWAMALREAFPSEPVWFALFRGGD